MIDDVSGWWPEILAAVSSTPFWGGIGVALSAVGVVAFCMLVLAPGESGPTRRQQRAALERRVYRAWCATHEWCPVHDVPDGQCPPVDTWVGSASALGACPGSGAVVVTADLRDRLAPRG